MKAPLTLCFIGGWGSTDELWQATLGDPALRTLTPFETRFLSWLDCLRDWPRAVSILLSLRGPAILVGWSLGAMLSLRAALDLATMGRERELAAMVLISAMPRMCATLGYEGADAHMLAIMRARIGPDRDAVLKSFARECVSPEGGKAAAKAYLAQARGFSPEALGCGLQALAEIDLRTRLSEVQPPCRLIHGSLDGIVPVASARFLAARLPTVSLEILDGCGHALPFTHPAEIARSIAAAGREAGA